MLWRPTPKYSFVILHAISNHVQEGMPSLIFLQDTTWPTGEFSCHPTTTSIFLFNICKLLKLPFTTIWKCLQVKAPPSQRSTINNPTIFNEPPQIHKKSNINKKIRFKYTWIYAWIWTIPTANMTYIRSQNYTNMVGGAHGIQTFEVVVVMVVVVIVWCFGPHKCTSLGQVVWPNILEW